LDIIDEFIGSIVHGSMFNLFRFASLMKSLKGLNPSIATPEAHRLG
jgi:hypothetical protein|tara:strand:- start:1517 stop:1654 length:138 start_codon:yes stop_codon:yes gene_type:complete